LSYEATIRVPDRPVGNKDIVFKIRKDDDILGRLKVSKGAVIALLGSTGRSKGPHVHFELLFQGKNCDPMPLFRPAAKRKDGAPAAPGLSNWKQANKRPKSIRCAPRKHHPDYVKRPGVPGTVLDTPAEVFEDEDEGGSDS